jgi:nucleoside-diphosphate-sugar epimerase
MPSDRRRVVVVGGRGYVGGRVAEHLAAHGWDVVVTGRTSGVALDLVRDDDARVDEVLAGAGAVVNCVAYNEHRAAEDPGGAKRVAVGAASRLAGAVQRLQVPRMLQLSTVHVYGELRGTIDEDRPSNPAHPYAAAHAAAEQAFLDAAGAAGGGTVLRLSNAIGPPVRADVDRWTLVTNDLARTWAERGRIVLRSAGTAKRDFVTLTDVSGAVHHLLDPTVALPPVLHLCAGQTRTVGDIAERLATLAESLSGTRPPVERPAGAGMDDVAPEFQLSNARLRATGFRPLDCIDEELHALLLFAKRHFGATS